ncbi:MAG TPA: ROK family protein, partial [bacterium]|nr:ROK family protein [bacterium]
MKVARQRKKKELVVGLDLGGTFIKAGLVNQQGKILKKGQWPTLAEHGKRQIVINQMKTAVDSLLGHRPAPALAGIGIGTPGLVDNQGRVFEAPNLPNWHNLALGRIFE